MPQDLALIPASPGDTVDILCIVLNETASWTVFWYKEEEGKNLRRIYQSSRYTKQVQGRYSSRGHNLRISDVQRNDSGVYYCATTRLLRGTRLVISGTSRPRLSLLVPSAAEDTELSHHIPLLCLLIDANPDEDTFSWDIGGETSRDWKDGDVIDGEGVFTVWSLKLMPPERWSQGMVYSCSDQEGRNISAVLPTNTVSAGNCFLALYYRAPCLAILLWIPPLVLCFRKRLGRAK
ncbi:uncharacterized protein LOC117039182 [Lacerta agilis]|uniref:uncharacterized protein LOC117039182 n=1 Tax=Lacerta agilis TaxID=80427 RepID=UPI0014199D00|nr:uncharacterized protein LOC117039182 [Lacerta agilis]